MKDFFSGFLEGILHSPISNLRAIDRVGSGWSREPIASDNFQVPLVDSFQERSKIVYRPTRKERSADQETRSRFFQTIEILRLLATTPVSSNKNVVALIDGTIRRRIGTKLYRIKTTSLTRKNLPISTPVE